eukprot:scaffold2125_cov363-Pavlova_lutheri.AAC.5
MKEFGKNGLHSAWTRSYRMHRSPLYGRHVEGKPDSLLLPHQTSTVRRGHMNCSPSFSPKASIASWLHSS